MVAAEEVVEGKRSTGSIVVFGGGESFAYAETVKPSGGDGLVGL